MANKWFKAAAAAAMAGVRALGAAACNPVWNGNVTLKDPGEIVAGSNGGFVVETENYLYFINGEESYTADNALGTPLKGALMAVEKAKLGTAEAEAELIVPKSSPNSSRRGTPARGFTFSATGSISPRLPPKRILPATWRTTTSNSPR